MRQTTAANEKIDPLMRIQEEIKEVKRREQEYRQLKLGDYDEADDVVNANDGHQLNDDNDNDNNNNSNTNEHKQQLSMSPEPVSLQNAAAMSLLSAPDDSSLASSVNSKDDSLDEQHSDDSGISASSSPLYGRSSAASKPYSGNNKERRYIGPNTYNLSPTSPAQKLLTRAVSTPQIFTPNRIIAQGPAQKGLMQRFIATRGKLMLNNNNNNMGAGSRGNVFPNHNHDRALQSGGNPYLSVGTPPIMSMIGITPPLIERDADGKPIRRGYIPVEVKIQRELKDYKSRESELKKYRKIRDSTPDLLDSINLDTMESEDEDSQEEHCYGPGKMRAAKSIGELCESMHSNNSISPSITPSPDFASKSHYGRGSGMRPAMSLAQLCDLDPEDAPSSHRLIAQWESIIKKNVQKCERE